MTPARRTAFVKIGEGVHSQVYRRPGSRFVVQVFKPDCPELTVDKVRREYAYLCSAYAELPKLVPWQRLIRPRADAALPECALVKEYVPHEPDQALHRLEPTRLALGTLDQLSRFLHITRQLLAKATPTTTAAEVPMLPDVIDPDFANLVIDVRTGDLALIDTNRLISTRKLIRLAAAGRYLDPEQHRIHALLLRRMMFLESKYLGRPRAALRDDPLYARYLDPAGFDALVAASAAAGEPVL